MKASAKTVRLIGISAVLAGSLFLLNACTGGGSGGGPAGNSTVTGRVDTFQVAGVRFNPAPPGESTFLRLAGVVGQFVVPDALAAVEGLTVELVGTGLSTTTANDGLFIMSGVPAGDQILRFNMSGSSMDLALSVPANATVNLSTVRIDRGGVHTNPSVAFHEAPPAGSNGNGNGNSNANQNANGNANGNSNGNDNDNDRGGNSGRGGGNDNGNS
jgi:hypothetical protein